MNYKLFDFLLVVLIAIQPLATAGTAAGTMDISAQPSVAPTSPNELIWTAHTSGTDKTLSSVTWGGSQFVAVGESGTILTSPDGVTWTASSSGTIVYLMSVTWGGSQFVAVGESGTILTSPDGVTWTPHTSGTDNTLLSVTWGGSQFVAVGVGGTILTSPDGETWAERISGTGVSLWGVTWSGSQFVAVGNTVEVMSGTILTSPDGETWITQSAGWGNFLFAVTWSGSQFVAVGGKWSGLMDPILTSQDGVTWVEHISGTYGEWLQGVTWGGSQFVAVGGSGTILTSPDGDAWTVVSSGTNKSLRSVTWSGSQFVAVGDYGIILSAPPESIVTPLILNYSTDLTQLSITITPESPTQAWSITETIPWLTLSSASGTGPATVTATVDRGGFTPGTYTGVINVIVDVQAITINVSMKVAAPVVNILTPFAGSTVYHSDSLLVKATVTHDGQPLAGAQVKGRIPLDAVTSVSFNLYDDGQNEDSAANDGIYAGRITLYGPLTMPTSQNPYSIIVTANAGGLSGSDSTTFNLAMSNGAPTVVLQTSSPSLPDYFTGEQMTITTTLTYPDASNHPDTVVMLNVTQPDLKISQVVLTNVNANTWIGAYTPLTGKGGHYYLDVRADPPDGLGFVDGWGTKELIVYDDQVTLAITPPGGPFKEYESVPIQASAILNGQPVTGLNLEATIALPDGSTETGLFEYKNGVYQYNYLAHMLGSHTITVSVGPGQYTANPASAIFSISGSEILATYLRGDFSDYAIYGPPFVVNNDAQKAAAEGDQFRIWLKEDKASRITSATFNLLSVLFSAYDLGGAVKAEEILHLTLPGLKQWTDVSSAWSREALNFVHFDLPLEFLQHLTDAGIPILAKEMTEAKMAFYLKNGRWDEAARLDLTNDLDLDFATADYQQRIQAGLSANFSSSLDTAVTSIAQDTEAWADSVADNLPYLSVDEENAYLADLMARNRANLVLSDEIRYMNNSLHMAYDLRIVRGEPPWWFYAGRTGLKFAWKLINPLGALVVTGYDAGLDYYYASEDIEKDQRIRDLAAHSLDRAFLAERWMWLNLAGGLATVEHAPTASPPVLQKGTIDNVSLVEERTLGIFKNRVYADVSITNPADSGGEAVYVLRALGIQHSPELRYVVADLMSDQNGDQRAGVTLQPGESATVRLYFYDKKQGAEEDMEASSPFNLCLLAFNEYGIFNVDAYHGNFNPDIVTTLGQAQALGANNEPLSLSGLGLLSSQSGDDQAMRFPVAAVVFDKDDFGRYGLSVEVENPFPQPMAYVISQPIPTGVTVLDPADGVVRDGEITWHRILQPREFIYLDYEFSYSGSETEQMELLPVSVSYHDASANATITLSTDPLILNLRQPLRGRATYDTEIAPQVEQEVSVVVTNHDPDKAHQGELILTLVNLEGLEVVRQTVPVSLAAGASQTYSLLYIVQNPGFYILNISIKNGNRYSIVAQNLITATQPDTPPGSFNKISPANSASNLPSAITLEWEPSTGATSYEYCNDTTNDNACSNWASNGASTRKTMNGLNPGTTYYWHVRAVNSAGVTYANGNFVTAFWAFTTGNPQTIERVSAGGYHTCRLESSGAITCWGWNIYGQTSVPSPNSNFKQVSAGHLLSCGLKATGEIVCWGNNSKGQTNVPSPNSDFKQVSAGSINVCGLKQDGSIVCWGSTDYGRTTIPAPNSNFIQVSVGDGYACGLKSDGTMVCWGSSSPIPSPNSNLRQISAGMEHICNVKNDNTISCGGSDSYGQSAVPPPNSDFVQVSSGMAHTCGLRGNMSIACWGVTGAGSIYNYGQTIVPPPNTDFVYVSAGVQHTCGVKNTGTILCWGNNSDGQINVPPELPAVFNKSSPSTGFTSQSTNVTLAWSSSNGATSNEYCYDTTNDNACTDWVSNGISTTKTLYGLSAGTAYYWHVRARNSTGLTYADSSPTAYWSFRIANPPQDFEKYNPLNGTLIQGTSITLIWNDSNRATHYEYCFDLTNDNNCSNWSSEGISRIYISPITHLPGVILSGLQPGVTYYWQVRAVGDDGITEADGGTLWSFTTTVIYQIYLPLISR